MGVGDSSAAMTRRAGLRRWAPARAGGRTRVDQRRVRGQRQRGVDEVRAHQHADDDHEHDAAVRPLVLRGLGGLRRASAGRRPGSGRGAPGPGGAAPAADPAWSRRSCTSPTGRWAGGSLAGPGRPVAQSSDGPMAPRGLPARHHSAHAVDRVPRVPAHRPAALGAGPPAPRRRAAPRRRGSDARALEAIIDGRSRPARGSPSPRGAGAFRSHRQGRRGRRRPGARGRRRAVHRAGDGQPRRRDRGGPARLLASYGVTSATMGCGSGRRWRRSTSAVSRPAASVRRPPRIRGRDLIVPINGVKPHTGFAGPVESGLMKMIAIGLGKQRGADTFHRQGYEAFAALIPAVARTRRRGRRSGSASRWSRTGTATWRRIEAIRADRIEARERELLDEARIRMPRLPLDAIDVLILDLIGKDISGTGMDPNVIGRAKAGAADTGPRIGRIVVRGLTPATEGNASGIGFGDVALAGPSTRSMRGGRTSTASPPRTSRARRSRSPSTPTRTRWASRWRPASGSHAATARIVRARSNKHLERLWISEPALPDALATGSCELIGDPRPISLRFTRDARRRGLNRCSVKSNAWTVRIRRTGVGGRPRRGAMPGPDLLPLILVLPVAVLVATLVGGCSADGSATPLDGSRPRSGPRAVQAPRSPCRSPPGRPPPPGRRHARHDRSAVRAAAAAARPPRHPARRAPSSRVAPPINPVAPSARSPRPTPRRSSTDPDAARRLAGLPRPCHPSPVVDVAGHARSGRRAAHRGCARPGAR